MSHSVEPGESAAGGGLSPRGLGKYHVMLHGIFKRAVRDRVILHNPCADTELPKVPPRKVRILSPEEFERRLAEIPDRFRDLVLTDIETGMRWGELVALRPRHVDFLRRVIAIEETVVEVSKKISPTGERMVFKAYPKDNEFRTLRVSQDLLDSLAARIASMGLDRDDLLFPSTQTKGPNPAVAQHASAPSTGCLPSSAQGSTSRCACTTSATPTPHGCWRGAPT
jgi:integrase